MSTTPTAESPAPASASPDAALSVPAALAAHGHDPAAYGWVPVLRKRRADGWSPGKQRAFIAALAATGSVMAAARTVAMSASIAYRLRRSPGAEGFAAAWDAALDAARRRRIRRVGGRALGGSVRAIRYQGQRVGERRYFNNRLAQYLLRLRDPARHGMAHERDDAARFDDAHTRYFAALANLAHARAPGNGSA